MTLTPLNVIFILERPPCAIPPYTIRGPGLGGMQGTMCARLRIGLRLERLAIGADASLAEKVDFRITFSQIFLVV
jgi:hypothetical protein